MDAPWTVKGLLADMRARDDAPAIIAVTEDDVARFASRDLADRTVRLAGGLLDAGLKPQEPVAIWGPNSADWAVAGLAVMAAGGTLAPIDDLAGDEDAERVVIDSGARRVFASPQHMPAVRALPEDGDRQLIRLGDADEESRDLPHLDDIAADAERSLPDVPRDAPVLYEFTSGTTGKAKAFHLTQVNIAANVEAIVDRRIVRVGDHVLMPLPFHHAYPWIVGILTGLTAGVAVVLPQAVTAPHLLRAMAAAEVTVMVGVPRLYDALMTGVESKVGGSSTVVRRTFGGLRDACFRFDERLGVNPGKLLFAPVRRKIGPKVRLMVSGGARLEPAVIRKIRGLGWQVLSGYGLAETASIFTANLPGATRVGSEGRVLTADGDIRIGEPDDSGLGEIQLRGSSVFSGYIDNPEANAAAFTEDGWFRTGDLGRLDDDGYVYVLGRSKELIVLSGGKNVEPEALEKAYGEHPYIAEIGVLERSGSLVALIRPDTAAIRADNHSRVHDAVRVAIGSVGRHRPPYQRLAGFAITREPLPRTRLLKIRRFMLPDLYERALAGEDKAPAAEMSDADRALIEQSPGREVWGLLQEKYPQQQLSLDTSPQLDLGMDSFAWMSFVSELETRTGARLGEEALGRIETLRDLIEEADKAEAEPEPVSDKAVDAMLRPPGPALKAIGNTIFAAAKGLMRTVFSLRVEGVDNVPKEGAVVLTANHVSDLDPVALAASLPYDQLDRTWWGADAGRLQETVLGRRLSRAGRVYPVNDRSPAMALAAAEKVLADGRIQVWFPESWRSPDGSLQRFLPGIGKLLSASRAAAVPVFIEGTFEAMPRDRRWPRPHRVRVVFGEPIPYEQLRAAAAGDEDYEGIAAALRERVAALAPAQVREMSEAAE